MEYLLSNWTPVMIPTSILLVSLLVFSVLKLRNNRVLAEKLCFYILGFVLIYKIMNYLCLCIVLKEDWRYQIPAEISQIAYIMCPLAFFTRNKWIRDGGAFLGIIAGAIELLAITVASDRFARTGLDMYYFVETLLMHYMVFWGGMVQVCCIEKMEWKNIWRTILVFTVTILWGVFASYTWMFGTDYGHPNEPANVGFTQRCDMLPDAWIEKSPWILEHHLFLLPYAAALMVFMCLVYLISNWSMKNVPYQEPSIYGLGTKKFKEFMTSNDVAKSYNDLDKK